MTINGVFRINVYSWPKKRILSISPLVFFALPEKYFSQTWKKNFSRLEDF